MLSLMNINYHRSKQQRVKETAFSLKNPYPVNFKRFFGFFCSLLKVSGYILNTHKFQKLDSKNTHQKTF